MGKNKKKIVIGGNVVPVIDLYHQAITRDTEETVEGDSRRRERL